MKAVWKGATVAESDEVNAAIPGAHTKNLFLKDKDGAYWLVTVPGDYWISLSAASDCARYASPIAR